MLAVPVLATLTDRIDARIVLLAGSALSALATFGVRAVRRWPGVGQPDLGPRRRRLCGRLHAGSQGADGSAGTGRRVAQRDALHGDLLLRRRSVVPDCATCGGHLRVARGVLPDRARPVGDDRGCARRWRPCQRRSRRSRPLFDFKPVLRNRPALGYVLGYGAHCFELYALRTWIVAFWTYIAARNGGSAAARADRRQRHRRGPRNARQHPGQRSGHSLRPAARDRLLHVPRRRNCHSNRSYHQCRARPAAGAAARVLSGHPGQLGRSHIGHVRERRPSVQGRYDGASLDGRLWTFGGGGLGGRCGVGCWRRHEHGVRMVARLPGHGRGRIARTVRALVVSARVGANALRCTSAHRQ